MKKFSQFIQEANNSLLEFVDKKKNLALFNAKRVVLPTGGRLIPDGHGGYHDSKTGEYVADSELTNGGVTKLKFFNQNQRSGKDPRQDRTKLSSLVPPSHQTTEEYEKELREKYISNQIFNEGDLVKNISKDLIGKIIRRGANHLICVTEDNKMFKSWIKDLVEWNDNSGVTADKREVGTDSLRKYVMKMTNTGKIDNFNIAKFINRNKQKVCK